IVAVGLIGVTLISALSLQALRRTLLEDRKEHILKVALLCQGVLERYHKLETEGKLTREEAQTKAKEALSGMRHEDDYIFVRTLDNIMLVHADQSRVGKVDKGSKTDDGRMTAAIYVEDLAKSDHTFMVAYVPRPGDAIKKPVPKLLGAIKYTPWDWIVGNGVFIDDLDAAFWSYAYRFLVIGGLVLATMAALGVLLIRTIQRQLGGEPQYAAEVVNRIASGDLHHSINVDGPDGSLLASMQRMQSSLRDVVGQIRDGSQTIQHATAEVASGNLDLSNRTEQAAAALQETAASIQNLAGNVRQNSDAAVHANTLAMQASEVARRGGQVVSNVVATMGEISASSSKISDIIGVIDGIAFQTNILALNAAVEAARAGDQGRGFAVVAGEVRTLAQRSAQAAREIKSLISVSVVSVEGGAAQVEKAGSTMQEIVTAVQQVTQIIGEISTSTAQQNASITELGTAINHMDQMTQQNAALVEEGAAAAASLREQAESLNQVVGIFRVDRAA
ncbi:MAG: methyl-accepting chemotaxis protein, partial [Rhodoferax sp.]